MGFLDKAKTAADQMATRAKEGVDEVQAKRNLQRAYEDLGVSHVMCSYYPNSAASLARLGKALQAFRA